MNILKKMQQKSLPSSSLKHFEKTIKELFEVQQSLKGKKLYQQICDNIEIVQEYVLLGDDEEVYFDAFCEQNIISRLFALLQQYTISKEIVQKIISTLASFISNIIQPTHLNYILSHSLFNSFIEFTYDFSDEEIVDYYITFLKSLSLRLNIQYMKLYFNQKYNYFPLLWSASKFYNHKSSIVATTVRYIILQLTQIEEPFPSNEFGKRGLYQQFLTSFPYTTVYVNYALHLKYLCLQLDQMIQEIDQNKRKISNLTDQMEKINDLLYFFNDLYHACPFLQKILDNTLLEYFVIPAIYSGIFQRKQNVKKIKKKNQETLSITFGLFIIIQLIQQIGSQLCSVLIFQLFSPKWKEIYTQPIQVEPVWYQCIWKPKSYWDDKMDLINTQCEELFKDYRVLSPQAEEQTDLMNSIYQFGKQILKKTTNIVDPFQIISNFKNNTLDKDIDTMRTLIGSYGISDTVRDRVDKEITKYDILLSPIVIENVNIELPTNVINGWKEAKNQLRESLEMFVMSKDESLLFSTMSLISLVYNYENDQVLNSSQINNDEFRQKIIISLINNLSSENTFKLHTIEIAVNIIQKFTQESLSFDHSRLKQLQIKAVQRFHKVLQRQVTWEYIYLYFYKQMDEKINFQTTTSSKSFDIRIHDVLPLNLGTEPLECRLPFNQQEEVLYEINFYLLLTRLSHVLGITQKIPQRIKSNIQLNGCYNIKPAPSLCYCELLSPIVENLGDLYIGISEEQFYVIECQTMQEDWAKIIIIEQYSNLDDYLIEKDSILIIKVKFHNLLPQQTNQLKSYTFRLHTEEKCIEMIATLKDRRAFSQQMEITSLNSYLELQEQQLKA